VTEDDLLNAREHVKEFTLEETREVLFTSFELPNSICVLTSFP
jgi:hypothetical protein